jgi:glycosyltransferase involved in cell wall biosynthesis
VPSFSIVIPSYRRPRQLAECLRALSRLEYPRDRFEVIVVDDGGDAPLDEVVAPFGSNLSLTLIRQPNAGPAAARNLGRSARGVRFSPSLTTTVFPTPAG